jgi:hypothetical protein
VASNNVTPIKAIETTKRTKTPAPKSVKRHASYAHDRVLQVKYILEALYQTLGPGGEEGPMAQYVLEGVAALLNDAEESLDEIEWVSDAPWRRRLQLKGRKPGSSPEAQS